MSYIIFIVSQEPLKTGDQKSKIRFISRFFFDPNLQLFFSSLGKPRKENSTLRQKIWYLSKKSNFCLLFSNASTLMMFKRLFVDFCIAEAHLYRSKSKF